MHHERAPRRPSSRHFTRGALACAIGHLTLAAFAAAVLAAPPPARAQAAAPARTYTIPPGTLEDALNRFGREAGILLSFPTETTAGLRSNGLQGSFTVPGGLAALLAGSGLEAVRQPDGSHLLRRAPAALTGDAPTLAPVVVTATAPESPHVSPLGYVAARGMTASKTDTPLREIAQSISVVTRDQMDAQGVQTVEQSLRYTAGVLTEVTGYDLRYASLNIRGFDATLYRDGLRVFKTGTYGDWLTEQQGIERVEVLKGPSAVLYGQGGPGGIVNQVSKRPATTSINEVSLSAGNHGRLQTGFDIGRPLNDDASLAFRINGMARGSDTQTAFSRDNRMYLAPSLTFQPNAATSLTLLADVTRDRMTPKSWWPNESLLQNWAFGAVPVEAFAGEPGFDRYDRDMSSVGYLFEHKFDDSLTLRQNLRYARFDLDYQHVYATAFQANGRVANRASLISRSSSTTTTIDTSVQKDFRAGGIGHRVVAGLDYQDFSGVEDIGFGTAPALDVANPVYGLPFVRPVTARNGAKAEQTGFYAQDQMKLGRWVMNLGLRRDSADTERTAGNARVSARDSKTSGSVGLLHLFDNGLTPYASWSTAFAPVVGTNYSVTPQPETSEQYELGLKYQPPGSNSYLTASLFDLRKQNVTTLDPANALLRVQTGEVRSRGLELEAKARIAAGLDLIASYTWLDATVTRSNDPNEVGKHPFQTARITAKLWMDYTFSEEELRGWGLGAGLRHTGASVADTYNRYYNPGYTLLDAALHYSAGPVRFALNIANLTDRATIANRAQFYGQGRSITASLAYRW